MGLFRVSARLTGPTGSSEDVELLVDTGATLLVVPRDLADRLGLVSRRHQRIVIAGGGRDVWPVAEVQLALDAQDVTTPCFIAPGGPALLGAVALESLFLAADPVGKRLVPVEGFVGVISRKAEATTLRRLRSRTNYCQRRVAANPTFLNSHGAPRAIDTPTTE